MSMPPFVFVLSILFLVVVLPIWLRLHYGAKREGGERLSEADQQFIDEALAQVQRLETRVETLETILDTDYPSWSS